MGVKPLAHSSELFRFRIVLPEGTVTIVRHVDEGDFSLGIHDDPPGRVSLSNSPED